jgi:hypothetical protein
VLSEPTLPYEDITILNEGVFAGCSSILSLSFVNLISLGNGVFSGCNNLATINLTSCTNMGGTSADNFVFAGITGQTITLTVPSALMTCNGGSPDWDIQYLQANNTVTVIQV